MFGRIKDCLCHPRYIGKYNKDKGGIVFLTILIFFLLAAIMVGARCYTEDPISETVPYTITSSIIRYGETNVEYKADEGKLTGDSFEINEDGFQLLFLPAEDKAVPYKLDTVTIVFKEESATIYYSNILVSTLDYQKLNIKSFTFANVAKNQVTDTYYFRIF